MIALRAFGLISVGHLQVRHETEARAGILDLAVASIVIVLVSFIFTTIVEKPGTAVALIASCWSASASTSHGSDHARAIAT